MKIQFKSLREDINLTVTVLGKDEKECSDRLKDFMERKFPNVDYLPVDYRIIEK